MVTYLFYQMQKSVQNIAEHKIDTNLEQLDSALSCDGEGEKELKHSSILTVWMMVLASREPFGICGGFKYHKGSLEIFSKSASDTI